MLEESIEELTKLMIKANFEKDYKLCKTNILFRFCGLMWTTPVL